MDRPTIGFIGQGFIGKNYADDFERRGFSVIRYALEEPFVQNKDRIKECDIVFVAVPTPTTPDGYDDSIVRSAVALARAGASVVIKSTLLPGTTEAIQKEFPDRIVMHSPEFLRVTQAARDAAFPDRNIIGVTDEKNRTAAEAVMALLPTAPYKIICTAREAEYVKYAGNLFLYMKVLFANLVYDVATNDGCDYDVIKKTIAADPRIGSSHLDVVHESGHVGSKPGRGAGGLCFIKDIAAFRAAYEKVMSGDAAGARILRALECKNVELLLESEKDLELLRGVYGVDPKQTACDPLDN
jgi:nucleotide sugar dehydrogenase